MTTSSSPTIAATTAVSPAAHGGLPAPQRSQRDPAIDLTKGALVVLMFVYHAVNYFCVDRNPLRYLHFLPASFIFITGFLLIAVQHPKLAHGPRHVRLHVMLRGVKLFVIFAGLNLAAHVLFTSNYNNPNFGLDRLLLSTPNILVVGGNRTAVFDVLLPISYLLVLSAALLVASDAVQRGIIALSTGILILGCLVLDAQGRPIYNLEMLSMGMLGMLAGLTRVHQIAGAARWLFTLLAANIVYAIIAGIRYPSYLMNILGVGLALLALFAIGRKSRPTALGYRWLTLLGRYSLVGYIVQIAVLQALYRLTRHFAYTPSFLVALIVAATLTTLIILAVDRGRTKFRAADVSYRALFA